MIELVGCEVAVVIDTSVGCAANRWMWMLKEEKKGEEKRKGEG